METTMKTTRQGIQMLRILAAAMALTLGLTSTATAQKRPIKKEPEPAASRSDKPTAKTHPQNPMIWDANTMMEEAVEQITKRYNLTNAQEEYTRVFLRARVTKFLDEYEMDVRELLHESIMMKVGQMDRSLANRQDWAKRALPVYVAAQEEILAGNEEWGQVLTAEQKVIHNKDLELMHDNFERVTGQLEAWGEGREWVPGQQITPTGKDPLLVKKDNKVSDEPPTLEANIEDQWIQYVNKFIETYALDESQKISARKSILKEHQDAARKYRQSKTEAFLEIKKLLAGPDGDKRRAELKRRERGLERPIYAEFRKLATRLDSLPETEQKHNADPILQKELRELWGKYSTPPSVEEPKVETGTRKTPPKNTDEKPDPSKQVPATQKAEESKQDSETTPKADEPKESQAAEKPVEKSNGESEKKSSEDEKAAPSEDE